MGKNMSLDIQIDNLNLVLTRMCNQTCKHCLRGERQNAYMNKEVVDKFFNNLYYNIVKINTLAFTGGEPFLNRETLIYIIDTLIKKNLIPRKTICVTNGLIFDTTLMDKFADLKQTGSLVILETTIDQFHKTMNQEKLEKFLKYDFYYYCEEHLDESEILRLGRALENNFGNPFLGLPLMSYYYNNLQNGLVGQKMQDLVYINDLTLLDNGKVAPYAADATWEMLDNMAMIDIEEDIFNQMRLENNDNDFEKVLRR